MKKIKRKIKDIFNPIKTFFQINSDRVFYRRSMYIKTGEFIDESGKYTLTVKVDKLYSLKGKFYQIDVGDCFMTDKNLYRLCCDMILYMNENAPGLYRMKEREERMKKNGNYKNDRNR